MAGAIRIEGVQDVLRFLDDMPQQMAKVSMKAMRSASRVTARHIRKGTPARWRKMVKYKVAKSATGNTSARMGLYNGKQTGGHQPKNGKTFDWFKAYWANYGTLKHRDPNHHFQTKIKKSRGRRNNVGQRPQHFFEMAINGWENVFVEEFNNQVKKAEDELY